MASKRVTVCDVCERVGRATERFRVTTQGRRYELDLCDEHAAPIMKVLSGREGRRHRPLRFEETITTMEDLERRKAESSAE